MYLIQELFDLTHTMAEPMLSACRYPWEALPQIGETICRLGLILPEADYDHPAEQVWIARSAVVAPTASITGPCIIGPRTEVRHCAFIRGNALIGSDAVVGNSTELKNVILFDGVQVPHYNYVGDSILGYKAHLGAGAITSNVKGDRKPVVIRDQEERVETGMKKVGAFLGDYAEIGCGSVLNPGAVIGRRSVVYPMSCVRGTVPADSIYKKQGEVAERE